MAVLAEPLMSRAHQLIMVAVAVVANIVLPALFEQAMAASVVVALA
jgi:hypothetical protein